MGELVGQRKPLSEPNSGSASEVALEEDLESASIDLHNCFWDHLAFFHHDIQTAANGIKVNRYGEIGDKLLDPKLKKAI
ncbi:MAG: hypothetical protein SFV18_16035 [Bryobacteraceae bacterium]|nr:hypothetical protein [Bryobacteraceae bacterium]